MVPAFGSTIQIFPSLLNRIKQLLLNRLKTPDYISLTFVFIIPKAFFPAPILLLASIMSTGFPGITSKELYGGEDLFIEYSGEEFYSNLLNAIQYKDNVVRMIGQCEVILGVADETFNVYMDVNKPSASIVIDRPAFTNIENGYGIFASRSYGGGLYSLNNFTKNRLKTFEQMNFIR